MKEKRIRIGNQTSFSASPITLPFEYAVTMGFDAFEWFPDKRSGSGWTEDDLSQDTRSQIKKTAFEHDIKLSVHTVWPSNLLEPESDKSLSKTIAFAQDIGASLLNIHLHKDAGIEAYGKAIIPLIERLADIDIKLSIENTLDTEPQDFNELFDYLRNIGSAHSYRVGMCLDLGHANLCETTRNDYLRFIDLLDPQLPIIHVHLHENYGDIDSHLPIFTGPAGNDPSGIIGFIERLKNRNFSGAIILEQWPEPEELLNDARKRLLEMIGSYMEPDVK
ncbi:MAG: TIM barrel protein, partial [Nitrospirae bacterium]|nr:TIM barrel protein [Nitrospirota bacterium]